jgi:secreted Zn-dependent insulinase-like peptidase
MLDITDEVASLDKMRFHQTSPGAVYSFASSVAESISIRGTEICLSAGSMLDENGDSLPLNEMLDFARQIRPQNCFIERYSNEAWEDEVAFYQGKPSNFVKDRFEFGLQTEKWYGVDYYVSPVDRKQIERWETNSDGELVLHLPKPNRYIPRTLSLSEDLPEEAKVQRIGKPIEPPELIVNKPSGESKHITFPLHSFYQLSHCRD